MSCVGTFSPDALSVIISTENINHEVNGFAEGTFISIEPQTDRFTAVYGARGESYRAHDPVKAFNVTLTLSQTSHSNDVMTYLLQNDRETLDGTFTITIKDSSGTTLYTERCAYIGTEPSQSFSGGGSIEDREWMVHMPSPDYVIGGNSRFTIADRDAVETLGGNVSPQWQPE